jgi:outer membrane protein OmpA-like peptidoglycan-associated protein
MKRKFKPDFFWISYSDLITSLFFIMLVLFVLAKVEWEKTKIELEEAKENAIKNFEELKKISESINKIERNGTHFKYDSLNRNFSMNKVIEFKTGEIEFSKEDKDYLTEAGKELAKNIKSLEEEYKNHEVKYTIILEGMASNIGTSDGFDNYKLSYERARNVKKLWDEESIKFTDSTEIQISGTGTKGRSMKEPITNKANQRVLVHVIPKVGKFNIEK